MDYSVRHIALWTTVYVMLPYGLQFTSCCSIDYSVRHIALWTTVYVMLPYGLQFTSYCPMDYSVRHIALWTTVYVILPYGLQFTSCCSMDYSLRHITFNCSGQCVKYAWLEQRAKYSLRHIALWTTVYVIFLYTLQFTSYCYSQYSVCHISFHTTVYVILLLTAVVSVLNTLDWSKGLNTVYVILLYGLQFTSYCSMDYILRHITFNCSGQWVKYAWLGQRAKYTSLIDVCTNPHKCNLFLV